MRFGYEFLMFLVAAGVALAAAPGRANDAPMLLIGGGASPAGPHQSICMESEEVIIRLRKDGYTVDATFHFFNTGETETALVGFPIFNAGRWRGLTRVADEIRFSTWIDGRRVTPSEKPDFRDQDRRFRKKLTSESASSLQWLAKSVTFPGQARITTRVKYEITYDGTYVVNQAHYIYGTGSYWKGRIGLASFIIDTSEIGKAEDLEVRFWFPDATSHLIRRTLISETLVKFEIKDFEPHHEGKLVASLRSGRSSDRRSYGLFGETSEGRNAQGRRFSKGEVIASSSKTLSIRARGAGGDPKTTVMTFNVGLKSTFLPFRRPELGEEVEIEYREEKKGKFAYVVKMME